MGQQSCTYTQFEKNLNMQWMQWNVGELSPNPPLGTPVDQTDTGPTDITCGHSVVTLQRTEERKTHS